MYPSSIILVTQKYFDKIISEEIENDIRSERQVLEPCYAPSLERFQRATRIYYNAKQALAVDSDGGAGLMWTGGGVRSWNNHVDVGLVE